MNKNILYTPILLLLFSLLVVSCENEDCIDNLGSVVTETRSLDSFHSIHFEGVGNVFLTQGNTQKVDIQANEFLLDHISIEVKNETLEIELDKCSGSDNYTLDFYITIPEIKELTLEGVGNLFASNEWNLDVLDVKLRGVGNATLQGDTDILNIESDGVGNVYSFDMTSRLCNVNVSGVGNAEVNVTEELVVEIDGSANVYYKGNPIISTLIRGSGNVIDGN